MFILVSASAVTLSRTLILQTTFDDLVQIPPHGIRNNQITRNDLEDKINEKYSNKVQRTTTIMVLILMVKLGCAERWTLHLHV